MEYKTSGRVGGVEGKQARKVKLQAARYMLVENAEECYCTGRGQGRLRGALQGVKSQGLCGDIKIPIDNSRGDNDENS